MTRERHYIPESRQREKPKSKYFAIGQSMKRVEDTRLLTGSGTYADDVSLPNMAHAAVLRSPHAHARIVSIDKSKAAALPGVLCVMTGAEAAEVTGPCADFSSPPTTQHCIAVGKVRHVGETVAAVVAESRYIAEDACELIEVEYDPLPVVVDLEEAVTSTGDAVLHPERGDTNVALQRTINFGTVDEDFARRRSGDRTPAALAALRRHADRDGRRHGSLRPRHRQVRDPRQHVDVQLCRLADRGLAQGRSPPAQHRAHRRRRQLRQQALLPQGLHAGRHAGPRRRPPGQVSGRPHRQHDERRRPRLRPPLRCPARAETRRHDAEHAAQGHRRLRRLLPVRSRPARQRHGAGDRPVQDQQRRGRPHRRVHQQVPAGGLSRLRLRGRQFCDRTPGRRGLRRARHRPHRDAPAQPDRDGPVPLHHADRQHVRQRQLPGRARRGARHDRLRRLAQEAGRGAQGGPLHRHRHLHLPGAERLQRHRVLDVEPERDARLHALELAGERGHQHRPHRQGVHHVERALLGQQSRRRWRCRCWPRSWRWTRRISPSATPIPTRASTQAGRAAAASR